jgi:hypothetical protein
MAPALSIADMAERNADIAIVSRALIASRSALSSRRRTALSAIPESYGQPGAVIASSTATDTSAYAAWRTGDDGFILQ